MNTEPRGPASASGGREFWSGMRFQEELRRVAHLHPAAPVEHPLAEALTIIEQNPAFLQSRLLARLLSALTYQQGEFRRAEVFAFDTKTRAVAIALLDTFAAGLPAREEWVRAVDAANAAQLGAG